MTERQPRGPSAEPLSGERQKAEQHARLDRLAAAMAVYLAHKASPDREPQQLLADHADLSDLLEPMLTPPHGGPADESSGPATPQIGTVLGDYRILRELGRGGMGTVYLAEQISLRRQVAFKLLHEHLTVTPTAIARFRREASAASGLQHPGIVPIHEIGEWRGRHYFTMEYLEGRPLNERMHEPDLGLGGSQSRAREAAQLVAAVADALQHAHDHGLVHRDIKPHNIMVTQTGSVHLLDFGLVRDRAATDASVTREFLGTPHYCSPEQIAGTPADARSDVFSLGIVLYELLAGRRPFAGDTTHAVLKNIEAGTAQPLQVAAPGTPRDLQVICGKAMARAPTARYATARALADDLRRHLRFEPIHAAPPSAIRRAGKWLRRHRIRVALWAAAAVVVLGAPAAWVLHDWDKRQHVENERRQLLAAERIAFAGIERTLQMLIDAVPRQADSAAQQREHVDAVVELCQDFLEARTRDPKRRARVANAFRVLSDVYLELRSFDAAHATCARGLELLGGPDDVADPEAVALARARLLRQDLRVRQFIAPAECDAIFERALAAWRPLLDSAEPRRQVVLDYAHTLIDRGRALADSDERQAAALPLVDEALERLEPLAANSPRARHLTIRGLVGRAAAKLGLGNATAALGDLEDVANRVRNAPPSYGLALESGLATILTASARQRLGELEQARTVFRQALADLESAIGTYPGSSHLRLARSRGILRFATLLLRTGHGDTAEEILRQHRARNGLPAPRTFVEREVEAQIAMLLGNCILVRTGGVSPADAIELMRGACETLQEIAAAEPDRMRLRLNLGGAYNNLAAIANERADFEAARHYAERAIAAQDAVLRAAPDNRHARLFLGMHQSQLATALAALDEPAGAIAACQATLANAPDNAGALRIAATAAAVAAERSGTLAHERIAVTALELLARLDPAEARRCLPDSRFAALRQRADFVAVTREVTR